MAPAPAAARDDAVRNVGCELGFEVDADESGNPVLVLHVAAAASAGTVLSESLVVRGPDGAPVPVAELAAPDGSRLHVVHPPLGAVTVSYAASLEPGPAPVTVPAPGTYDHESVVALRPSRYCPSDELAGFAVVTVPLAASRADMARTVADWVFEHITLEPGWSGPTDSALDTLHASRGVCRDFAHLVITLCRALGVPARFTAVYAPGLTPMEFHAVAEVRTEHGWEVLDATRQAPRQSLVRIGTGRDAADVAFATTVQGRAELLLAEASATTDADLHEDDHVAVVRLA